MPKNNKLKPAELPIELRFGEKPTTKFINSIKGIDVELVDWPDESQLERVLPVFTNATWLDNPSKQVKQFTDKERTQIIYDAFHFKYLPQSLETVRFTFQIKGIDLQTVTHLIRHKNATFSARCTGDRWKTHDDCLVPSAVEHSKEYYERWKTICEDAKQLYCDMIDSKKISLMDARTIMPMCFEQCYLMSCDFMTLKSFLDLRIDKQIQPEVDNALAYLMYIELLKKVPYLVNTLDIHQPALHYVKMARSGKATNLYFPDSDSDIFEWNEHDFIYQSQRNELNGTDEDAVNEFDIFMSECEKQIELESKNAISKLTKLAGEPINL